MSDVTICHTHTPNVKQESYIGGDKVRDMVGYLDTYYSVENITKKNG